MSEIKGQLVGVLLVLTIFGIISVALIPTFQQYAQKIQNEANANTDLTLDDIEAPVVTRSLMHY